MGNGSQLETVMQEVKCEIISTSSTDELDAYVLSESSMFISARRFILKTCGTTTPLSCLLLLISLAKEYAGYDVVQDLYYSRKNFKRPELQMSPHRTFEDEASMLDQLFAGGRAYCMGSLNRADCWYLYAMSPGRLRYLPNAARHNLPHCWVGKAHREPDQTLEVLMMDLDPEKMKLFWKDICPTASEATKRSGIDKLIPDMMIDDYQFDPCGYSMNGLMRTVPGGYMTIHITPEPEFSYVSFETNVPQKSFKDLIARVVATFGPKQFVMTFFTNVGGYMTIHITPEPEFSYVSFETNVPQKSFKDLIARVVATFGPKQFVMTFFTNVENTCNIGIDDGEYSVPQYSDYDVDDVQICRLQGYDLTYALYNKYPS
ncbi:S-adenosylmethionine decarboxylase proenzyme [Chionoecetes opilio]|uniref:S-adenosylmethionine decarboxylase proenzyme n=1 Tax=Chionoecetes opilio TaxID=41210 RepID=A0A8J4XQQ0_CHIOP|nr:S-adenosylmethionine decarboxylase proenzyme [Chionoecetes opilio]